MTHPSIRFWEKQKLNSKQCTMNSSPLKKNVIDLLLSEIFRLLFNFCRTFIELRPKNNTLFKSSLHLRVNPHRKLISLRINTSTNLLNRSEIITVRSLNTYSKKNLLLHLMRIEPKEEKLLDQVLGRVMTCKIVMSSTMN